MKENKLVLEIAISRLSKRDRDYLANVKNTAAPTKKNTEPAKQPILDQIADDGAVLQDANLGEVPRIELTLTRQGTIANEGLRKPLAQKDFKTVLASLKQLEKGWPKEPQESLVEAVEICAETGNFSIDETALMLLMKTDPTVHIDVLDRTVDRQEFKLRMIAYQSLVAINDDRALEVLMRRFDSDDNVFIGKLLPKFGNRAEEKLQEHLNHIESNHVLVTVSVLVEVGTKQSIPNLTKLAKESDKIAIRQQANTAIKKIEARAAAPKRE